jgi:hypothetical protein
LTVNATGVVNLILSPDGWAAALAVAVLVKTAVAADDIRSSRRESSNMVDFGILRSFRAICGVKARGAYDPFIQDGVRVNADWSLLFEFQSSS